MMTTREIQAVIRAAGRSPVERDTLYNVVHAGSEDPGPGVSTYSHAAAARVSPGLVSTRSNSCMRFG
jgi:hypothetical protein